MGKIKNKAKTKRLSENATNKILNSFKTKLNPFEIHRNKQKHKVLGQKSKNDRGIPGIARAKALKKRKETLMLEYKLKDKANIFIDKRLGEKKKFMTKEDKLLARFTTEQIKIHKQKKSIYNLADDEILTHKGQTLNEVEKFDDPRSDDEEFEDSGKLDSEFVSRAHFGGGVDAATSRDRKDIVNQLIAESKLRKAENQRTLDENAEMTEKLDTEWKELHSIVSVHIKKNFNADSKMDDFDKIVNSLKFDQRGKATERLKSEEEIVQQEKKRLEKLEAERIKRMHGFMEEEIQISKHRSADDIDDGFEIFSDSEVLAYNTKVNGLVQPINQELFKKELERKEVERESEDHNNETSLQNCGNSDASEDEDNTTSSVIDDDNDVDDSSTDDNLSDMKEVSSAEEEEEKLEDDDIDEEELKKIKIPKQLKYNLNQIEENRKKKIKTDLLARKDIMEKARKELPFTFEIPEKYDEFYCLMQSRNPTYQSIIVERMMKCNHISFSQENKKKLQNLFAFIIQHIDDMSLLKNEYGVPQCFVTLDQLATHLYDLAVVDSTNAGQCIAEVLKGKHLEFKKKKNIFPEPDVLVLMKMVSLMFPTSDFQHPIVTPALVFINKMLTSCKIRKRRDIAIGLYLVTLMLEYSVLSKRFCPAAINFLYSVLYLSLSSEKKLSGVQVPPCVKSSVNSDGILFMSDSFDKEKFNNEDNQMWLSDVASESDIDDNFKVRSISTAVALLLDFKKNVETHPICSNLHLHYSSILSSIAVELLPKELGRNIDVLQKSVLETSPLRYISVVQKKTKLLRLYEPIIHPVHSGKKKANISAKKEEKLKLLHRYKKEMKGALREIRLDSAFITKLKMKEMMQSDLERKQKVKEIFGSAALQQGELKKMKRGK